MIKLKPAVKFVFGQPPECVYNIITGRRHNEIYDFLTQTYEHIWGVEEGFLYEDKTFVSRAEATTILQKEGYLPLWYKTPLTSEILDFLLGRKENPNPLLNKIRRKQ